MRLKLAKVSRYIGTSTISGIVFGITSCSFDNLKQSLKVDVFLGYRSNSDTAGS